jgi:hypothetical protein
MRRALRPPAGLAMLSLVAVISAGCSNAPADTGSSNSTAATHEKFRRRALDLVAAGQSGRGGGAAVGGQRPVDLQLAAAGFDRLRRAARVELARAGVRLTTSEAAQWDDWLASVVASQH